MRGQESRRRRIEKSPDGEGFERVETGTTVHVANYQNRRRQGGREICEDAHHTDFRVNQESSTSTNVIYLYF